jgi:hypothetical protein
MRPFEQLDRSSKFVSKAESLFVANCFDALSFTRNPCDARRQAGDRLQIGADHFLETRHRFVDVDELAFLLRRPDLDFACELIAQLVCRRRLAVPLDALDPPLDVSLDASAEGEGASSLPDEDAFLCELSNASRCQPEMRREIRSGNLVGDSALAFDCHQNLINLAMRFMTFSSRSRGPTR